MRRIFLLILLWIPPSLHGLDVAGIFSGLEGNPVASSEIDQETLSRLMQYAADNSLTLFELLNEAVLYLASRELRLHIQGDTLREVNTVYDLGGRRVNVLLPVEKITDIFLGKPEGPSEAQMEVLLDGEYAEFLELATFKLSRRFGFTEVKTASFNGAFGIVVKNFFLSFDLSRIEIYKKNKIAIYVERWGKPKRWNIKSVTRR